jgi:hypothetical protein
MSHGSETARPQPRVDVHFDRPHRGYEPGDTVVVRYTVSDVDPSHVRGIEQSLAWYTEGKGEEDLGVHFFSRLGDRQARETVATGGGFSAPLPPSPLSYEGVIVKIRWCVRVRLFFPGGRDFVSEHEFEVGRIPAARMTSRASA